MTDFLQAPFTGEFIRTVSDMYARGWDERNGGNLSLLLTEEEIRPYVDPRRVLRRFPVDFSAEDMAGRYLLVTATGRHFRTIPDDPEGSLGLLRPAPDGKSAELLWGFAGGGAPTSELAAHILGHAARLAVDPAQRVLAHSHPSNLVAMSHVHPLEDRAFTRTLWQMLTECFIVFPDGIGVLPWMLCGTPDIARATADKLKSSRLVLWALHGIYGAGPSLEEAFGLIETAEKAAGIYLQTASLPRLQSITDADFHALERRFDLHAREGFLAD